MASRRYPLAKRLKASLGTHLMMGIMRLAVKTPVKRMYRFAEVLGKLAYSCSGKYQRIGLMNIRQAYPEMTEPQAEAMLRRVFRSFAISMVEFLMADRFSDDELRKMVTVENYHYYEEAAASGEGVLLISAHMGSWELCARGLARLMNIPLYVVARDSDDQSATTLVNTLRERSGYKVISKGGSSALKILRALKHGKAVVLMSDQNSRDVFVPFFGRMAGCVAGPATIALRSGAKIVPIVTYRKDDGTHVYEFGQPIPAIPTDDVQADTVRIITEVQSVLEGYVRKHPDQWLWFHNRWKCRPPEEVSKLG